MRAIRERRKTGGSDEFPRSDGSAKVALIAIDRSIGAGVIPQYNRFYGRRFELSSS
jgi:hypothetical protein